MSEYFNNRKCVGCDVEYSSRERDTCPECGTGLYMEVESPQEKKERVERAEIDRINAANALATIKLDEEPNHVTTKSSRRNNTSNNS